MCGVPLNQENKTEDFSFFKVLAGLTWLTGNDSPLAFTFSAVADNKTNRMGPTPGFSMINILRTPEMEYRFRIKINKAVLGLYCYLIRKQYSNSGVHLKCVPCYHGMARPLVADGEEGQIWRVAMDILNK
jgi:hypothetical protein